MLKQFFLKKLAQSQLKNLPKDQQAKIGELIEKHPELLLKLASEVQEEMKKGKTQQEALMTVALAHKDALKGLL